MWFTWPGVHACVVYYTLPQLLRTHGLNSYLDSSSNKTNISNVKNVRLDLSPQRRRGRNGLGRVSGMGEVRRSRWIGPQRRSKQPCQDQNLEVEQWCQLGQRVCSIGCESRIGGRRIGWWGVARFRGRSG